MNTEWALWDHLFPFSLSRAPIRANNNREHEIRVGLN
jgi:hypothetical protein